MAILIRIFKLLYCIFAVPIVECQQACYRAEFRLTFFGSLPNDSYKTIFTAVGATFGGSMNSCYKICSEDQRCIGIETCKIREDLFQCRVCCEWKKLGKYVDQQPGCRYLEMDDGNGENLASVAELSTTHVHLGTPLAAARAVDGIVFCTEIGQIAHTAEEMNPWLSIGLKRVDSSVKRVVLYSMQNCCGDRLHDVHVNVIGTGSNSSCGFYPGPAISGDRIVILCRNDAVGHSVNIQISSKVAQRDIFSICEVEVYS